MLPTPSSLGTRYDDDINVFGLKFAPLSIPLERRLQVRNFPIVWFGLVGNVAGSCEKECLKVQFTAHQTISIMADSMTVRRLDSSLRL